MSAPAPAPPSRVLIHLPDKSQPLWFLIPPSAQTVQDVLVAVLKLFTNSNLPDASNYSILLRDHVVHNTLPAQIFRENDELTLRYSPTLTPQIHPPATTFIPQVEEIHDAQHSIPSSNTNNRPSTVVDHSSFSPNPPTPKTLVPPLNNTAQSQRRQLSAEAKRHRNLRNRRREKRKRHSSAAVYHPPQSLLSPSAAKNASLQLANASLQAAKSAAFSHLRTQTSTSPKPANPPQPPQQQSRQRDPKRPRLSSVSSVLRFARSNGVLDAPPAPLPNNQAQSQHEPPVIYNSHHVHIPPAFPHPFPPHTELLPEHAFPMFPNQIWPFPRIAPHLNPTIHNPHGDIVNNRPPVPPTPEHITTLSWRSEQKHSHAMSEPQYNSSLFVGFNPSIRNSHPPTSREFAGQTGTFNPDDGAREEVVIAESSAANEHNTHIAHASIANKHGDDGSRKQHQSFYQRGGLSTQQTVNPGHTKASEQEHTTGFETSQPKTDNTLSRLNSTAAQRTPDSVQQKDGTSRQWQPFGSSAPHAKFEDLHTETPANNSSKFELGEIDDRSPERGSSSNAGMRSPATSKQLRSDFWQRRAMEKPSFGAHNPELPCPPQDSTRDEEPKLNKLSSSANMATGSSKPNTMSCPSGTAKKRLFDSPAINSQRLVFSLGEEIDVVKENSPKGQDISTRPQHRTSQNPKSKVMVQKPFGTRSDYQRKSSEQSKAHSPSIRRMGAERQVDNKRIDATARKGIEKGRKVLSTSPVSELDKTAPPSSSNGFGTTRDFPGTTVLANGVTIRREVHGPSKPPVKKLKPTSASKPASLPSKNRSQFAILQNVKRERTASYLTAARRGGRWNNIAGQSSRSTGASAASKVSSDFGERGISNHMRSSTKQIDEAAHITRKAKAATKQPKAVAKQQKSVDRKQQVVNKQAEGGTASRKGAVPSETVAQRKKKVGDGQVAIGGDEGPLEDFRISLVSVLEDMARTCTEFGRFIGA